MGKFIDLTGKKFGRLIVIKRDGLTNSGSIKWQCKCDCGCVKTVDGDPLRRGVLLSCGCLQKEKAGNMLRKHGMYKSRFYNIWRHIKSRCNDVNVLEYKWYGKRGITYDKRWEKFENFRDDMYESYLKHAKEFGEKQTTIDRIDNNRNYCKENCKWATMKEQALNTSRNHYLTYKGDTKTISEWSEKVGINKACIGSRIRLGWSVKKALTTPIKAYL